MTDKIKIVKCISIIVIITGILVMLGWILDIQVIKSISAGWISMKFMTSLSFILSGILLYVIAKTQEKYFNLAPLILLSCSTIILLFITTTLIGLLFGYDTGIEQLFIKESPNTAQTFFPGVPAIPTMLSFIAIAVCSLLITFKVLPRRKLAWFGLPIGIIGAMPIAGYILSIPLLYYKIEGINNPMAFHTALLFSLIGIGFILLGKSKDKPLA